MKPYFYFFCGHRFDFSTVCTKLAIKIKILFIWTWILNLVFLTLILLSKFSVLWIDALQACRVLTCYLHLNDWIHVQSLIIYGRQVLYLFCLLAFHLSQIFFFLIDKCKILMLKKYFWFHVNLCDWCWSTTQRTLKKWEQTWTGSHTW